MLIKCLNFKKESEGSPGLRFLLRFLPGDLQVRRGDRVLRAGPVHQSPARMETTPRWCPRLTNYKLHAEKTWTYKKEDRLNFTNVDFPTPVEQVPRIERQKDLAISMFGYMTKEGVFPLYVSKNNLQVKPINLLLSSDKNKSHYC